ncbi:hypothetical protein T4B_10002 [Trichinella pseudospiralis]|uniref:Uncharacterized protein n=1 Tax=Trichinella pseudospiralis TaxID=6337 RepID=A0A0V1IIF1_TRIPS|nr:hypothetical protein T4B_10002 [Trichinella pseudospiralis]
MNMLTTFFLISILLNLNLSITEAQIFGKCFKAVEKGLVLLPDLDSFSELAFREFCKFIWQLNIRRSRLILGLGTGPARRTHFAISDGSRWRILYHSTCQYIFIRNIKYFMMCCFYSFFIKFGLLQRYCWVLCFHENNFCFENFLELLYLAIM